MRFGCQTYTWLMSGEKYKGRVPHILRVARGAHFEGLEPEVVMLGALSDPAKMNEALAATGMQLGGVCLVEDWAHQQEAEMERARADQYIKFLTHFPGCMFVLCQMPGKDRRSLSERQQNLLSCVNAIALRAARNGVPCSYHPNSPEGSVFRTAEEYELLLNCLVPETIGFAADVGHIARGGMDPVAILRKYRERVNHVHFKDMCADGQWAGMGRGTIDFPQIVSDLHRSGFEGWVMIEDECAQAELDPDASTVVNGSYVRDVLSPLCSGVHRKVGGAEGPGRLEA
jgi:inosose dehydratase